MTAAGKHYAAYRLSGLGYTPAMTDSNMFVDMLAINNEDDSNPAAAIAAMDLQLF